MDDLIYLLGILTFVAICILFIGWLFGRLGEFIEWFLEMKVADWLQLCAGIIALVACAGLAIGYMEVLKRLVGDWALLFFFFTPLALLFLGSRIARLTKRAKKNRK